METAVIILIIVAIAGALFFIFYTKKKEDAIKKSIIKNIETRVSAITDKRIVFKDLQIWVENGASVTEEEIQAIVRGLEECFMRARKVGYDRPLNVSDYKIAIIADCMRAPESQVWCYKLPAGPYAGTEWDLGGFILAAGQVIAAGEPYGNIIALPEHEGMDLEQLSVIAASEAEHVILAYCDGDKFYATQVHGTPGSGHPLFGG